MSPGEPVEKSREQQVQALFLENVSQIRGFILALVPDAHRANDIFQDVFMTMTRLAAQFESGSNFLAWVRAIARNKILQEQHRCIKRQHSHLPLDETLLECLEQEVPEMEEAWAERKAALTGCLDQVAPKARQIVDLRFQENLLPEEIARKVSWSVNAVRVALTRARRFLFDCVERKVAKSGG